MDFEAAGLDYKKTSLAEREKFAFTAAEAAEFLTKLRHRSEECVLLSTCNRTELFTISETHPADFLHELRGSGEFYTFSGEEALRHVYDLAAGLDSQVPFEEQILAQMKEALALSQTMKSCGPVLAQMFKSAVTAGKEIRTALKQMPDVRSASVARLACQKAEEALGTLDGRNVLVIGSGEMGMLCSDLFRKKSAHVCMTLRRRRNDGRKAPAGVVTVPYDSRYEIASGCDIIVGATSSPHFVVQAKKFRKKQGEVLALDIAVPRDIEPSVGAVDGVTLLDMDSLGGAETSPELKKMAEEIIQKRLGKFSEWYQMRECMPMIEDICSYAEHETDAELDGIDAPDGREKVSKAARGMVSKLLFAVKDRVGVEEARSCYAMLSKAVRG